MDFGDHQVPWNVKKWKTEERLRWPVIIYFTVSQREAWLATWDPKIEALLLQNEDVLQRFVADPTCALYKKEAFLMYAK